MALYDMYTEDDGSAPYEKPNAPSRIPSLKSQFVSYITSPTYKKRLEKQGVKNPDKVIKERLNKLNQAVINVGPAASLDYIFTNPNQKERVPSLTVKEKDSDYTMMHELSHVTNYGDVFFDPKAANPLVKVGDSSTASGKGMSVDEMLYMTSKSNLPMSVKKSILSRAESNKGYGTYRNPTEGMPGESHSFDPSEFKSDLDAVRLLLNREGITKNFGEDISEETINKALSNPKIANEPHFKRMLKNFSKKNIVDINNSVAMNSLARNTMA